MNKNLDEFVEKRLEEWATWFLRGGGSGVGYPPESVIMLFQTGAGVDAKNDILPHFLPVNEEAEEIERSIRKLSDYNKILAEVLKEHYLCHELTRSQKAVLLGISITTYRVSLVMAKMWISGYLGNCVQQKNKL